MVSKLAKRQNMTNVLLSILVIALVISGIMFIPKLIGGQGFSIGDTGEAESLVTTPAGKTAVVIDQTTNKAATLYFSSYTGTWGDVASKTLVYPTYTITNAKGSFIISDAAANSTTKTFVGDIGKIYGTGSSYYLPITEFSVTSEVETVQDIKAEQIVATTDLVITVYDENEIALTADDNANNTADYAGGDIGASENKQYFIEMKNSVADKTFRLGAILTYYCGDEVDDFTLEDEKFTETTIPSGDLLDSFTHYDDTNASTSCSIKHAYVPTGADFIALREWEKTGKLSFILDADDSTQPAANGDSYVGAIFVDYSCEQSETGEVICDWYKHDQNNDADDVGLNEAVIASGYKGLDVGASIEPQ